MRINSEFALIDYYIQHNQDGLKDTVGFTVYNDMPCYQECFSEAYVQELADGKRYVIKEIDESDGYIDVVCKLDLNDLEKHFIEKVELTDTTLSYVLNTYLVDMCGYTYYCNTTMKTDKAEFKFTFGNVVDILEACTKAWGVYFHLNNVTKSVEVVYEDAVPYTGMYITQQLNIISNSYQEDTYNLVNRLYVYGKDDKTIESVEPTRHKYLDNFSYTTKVICGYVKYSDIDDARKLYDLGLQVIAICSQPKTSYSFKIFNLSKFDKNDYSLKDLGIHKIVKYMDSKRKKQILQRVVKWKEYPLSPNKDEITLSSDSTSIVTKFSTSGSGTQVKV